MFMNAILKFLCDLRSMVIGDDQRQARSISNLVQSIIVFITILFATPAIGDLFIGAKIGKVMVDVPSSSDPTNIAASIGYGFDSLLADLSLVGEVNRTMSSGTTSQGDDLEFESEAVYLVWKSTRSLFATLRGGVVQNETITGSTSLKSNGILIGGSVGLVIGKTRLQLEYTSLAGHADFLAIGLEF